MNLSVLKTYKIYIGGSFPRTESGRYYPLINETGKTLANVCLSSRKDVRNAILSARKAFSTWSEKSCFNRAQILYRMAEMLEGRKQQFIDEMLLQGLSKSASEKEISQAINRILYYAGWADKYIQVSSSVNPVNSSHFNFSNIEPMGVVGIIAPQNSSLLGFISLLIPAICGGNTVLIICSETLPLNALTFAEVINSSDVPGGVVNILSGKIQELAPIIAAHMDVNAFVSEDLGAIQIPLSLACVDNLKRQFVYDVTWEKEGGQGLHFISDIQEVKTTWHPIENIGGSSSSY